MKVTYKRVTQVTMAGAVSLLFGTGAEAAKIGAVWDPAFGGNLNGDLWWSGVAEFSLPDGCLLAADTGSGPAFVQSGINYEESGSATCDMSLNFANVTLYNNPPGIAAGTSIYNFGPQNFNSEEDGMWIKSINEINTVVGIQTADYSFLLTARSGSGGTDPDSVYDGPLWLWFTSPDDGEFDPAHASTRPLCDFGNFPSCDEFAPADYDSDPAILSSLTTCNDAGTTCVTVTAVPEPGTMGLALGALGAGWFARRRKKTA